VSPNFVSRYSRTPIKGSKDSDDSLVSKKILTQKIGSLDWRPRLGKLAKKNDTWDVFPRDPQTQNKKILFQFQLEDLLNL